MIKVDKYIVSDMQTNCYILKDEKTGLCAIVDPGAVTNKLKSELLKIKDNLKYIILTHGHYDHVNGVNEVVRLTGAKVVICEKEKEFLENDKLNLAHLFCDEKIVIVPDLLLKDGDILKLGETDIKMIETPGHTVGGACFIAQNVIFAGDTLFYRTVGRIDFPTGNYKDMMASLKKLKNLKGDYIIYSGHDMDSTLEAERKHNPYMRKV